MTTTLTTIEDLANTLHTDTATITAWVDQIADDSDLWDREANALTEDGVAVVTTQVLVSPPQIVYVSFDAEADLNDAQDKRLWELRDAIDAAYDGEGDIAAAQAALSEYIEQVDALLVAAAEEITTFGGQAMVVDAIAAGRQSSEAHEHHLRNVDSRAFDDEPLAAQIHQAAWDRAAGEVEALGESKS